MDLGVIPSAIYTIKQAKVFTYTNNESKVFHKFLYGTQITCARVDKLTIIGSDNGLSPRRPQAIIWTNAGILLFGPLGTNFGEILIGIQTVSFKKMLLKISSAKRHQFCLGLNVLREN